MVSIVRWQRNVVPMNTPFISPALAPPLIAQATLLLAEICPIKTPALPNDLTPQHLADRATVITSVLKEIITPRGWAHGGIND